jgi:precorrin-8X/cobalt-precorrin-8 methylmutase
MTIIIMGIVTGTMATTAEAPTVSHFDYVREPAAIYRRSREIALAETDLDAVADDMREVALRLVHACGEPSVVADLRASPGAGTAGGAALANRAAILCDTEMVTHGVIRAALPKGNRVECTLNNAGVTEAAKRQGMTRSAAAVDLWDDDLDGAIVAIGNAPTALYRLLERLADGAPKPALIVAMPVGFVGAAESKQALIDGDYGVPYMALTGRRGGSALAAAAVNALATPLATPLPGGDLS